MPVLKFWNPRTRRHEPVSGPIGIMGDAPGVVVRKAVAQSWASGVGAVATFDTIERDTHGFWNSGQPSRLTVPAGQAGLYRLSYAMFHASGVSPAGVWLWQTWWRKNGATVPGPESTNTIPAGYNYMEKSDTRDFYLVPGDYIELYVNQTTGAASGIGVQVSMVRQAVGQPGPQGPPGPPDPPVVIGAEIYLGAASQSISEFTYTRMSFNQVRYDHGGVVQLGTSQFRAPVSGYYAVWASIFFQAYDDTYHVTTIVVNGTTRARNYSDHAQADGVTNPSAVLYLNAGDLVWFEAMRGGNAAQTGVCQLEQGGISLLSGPKGDPGPPGSSGEAAWTLPTMYNGWLYYGAPYSLPGYRRDGQGIVHLRGLIKSGTINATVFTLPPGYRPEYDCIWATTGVAAFAEVRCSVAGNVVVFAGSNTYVSLDGLHFLNYPPL